MKPPTVDVVLPYNRVDQYLQQAIDSVLRSEFVQLKLILINDTGKSQNFFYNDARILYVNTSSRGYGNALNVGIRMAKSHYVALMNSDDLIHPRRLINQIHDLERKNADVSYGNLIKFSHGRWIIPSKLGSLNNGEFSSAVLLLGSYGADASACWKRSALADNFFNINTPSDWLSAIETSHRYKVILSPRAKYFYRQHRLQTTQIDGYQTFVFHKVYPHWKELCKDFGLELLSESCAALVCAPWATQSQVSKVDIESAAAWFSSFNKITNKKFKKIINRRILYMNILLLKTFSFKLNLILPSLLAALSYILDFLKSLILSIKYWKFFSKYKS